MDLSAARQELETLANTRILVGHQSVGRGVLAGLKSLAAETGVEMRIVTIDGVPPDDGSGIFHATIGANGDPNSKCDAFERLVSSHGAAYDAAMMKFCYEDLREDTPLDVTQMLDRYENVVTYVREQCPDTQLVHISIPLLADPPGKKTILKRLFRWSVETDEDNALRNMFNAGLHARYSTEPFFDLAALESTRPDGSRSSFMTGGRRVYTLAPELTTDGGHLNAVGQRRAAAELARVLASTLGDRAR